VDQTGGIGIDQVGFREDDNATLDTEQAANVEMLAGLGLDGFVAAITKRTKSTPAAPASMLVTKRSCPGRRQAEP